MVGLRDPQNAARQAFFAVLGDTPSTAADQRPLLFKQLSLALRAVLIAAEPARAYGIAPMPRILVESPEPMQQVGSTVQLRWRTDFVRWDDRPYTSGFPADHVGDDGDLVYTVCWRRSSETEYHALADDAPFVPGVLPPFVGQLVVDAGSGAESYSVQLPDDRFPPGEYMLRIDCFHSGDGQHVAHHEVRVQRL